MQEKEGSDDGCLQRTKLLLRRGFSETN